MKMKYVVMGYTVVVALLLCFIYIEITKENKIDIDMVYYNRQLKSVEEELRQIDNLDNLKDSYNEKDANEDSNTDNDKNSGITTDTMVKIDSKIDSKVDSIEEKHNCIIILTIESDYGQKLNKLISDGAIIFDYVEDGKLMGKVAWQQHKNRYEEISNERGRIMFVLVGITIFAGYMLLAFIYYMFIRPFHQLERFSTEIAKGNLDFRLQMTKRNMFGAFTESFDIMREELKSAREREYQANISKKELVAELSHDIKTPVSTIKATCEVMQLIEENPAMKNKLDVILNKANMIDELVGNMFHATMEELQVLKVEAVEESTLVLTDMFNDLKYYGNLIMDNEIPQCLVYMDKLRMKQVIDNVVNNSYKYAGTDIHVSFKMGENICITIRDSGTGVPDEELALVTEKYYRGSNAKGKSGSGIGLYLCKTFMKQMGGDMEYYNDEGFVVELVLKKV